MVKNGFDVKTQENWLWEAACKIREEIDAPKYKDYILSLIFLKRLSDVFEDEVARLAQDYGSRDMVEQLLSEDHGLVRFYLDVYCERTRRKCNLPHPPDYRSSALPTEAPAAYPLSIR